MSREEVVEKTSERIKELSDNRLLQLAEFAEFLLRKQEEDIIQDGIQQLAMTSGTFDFLMEDPVTYTLDDCKERFTDDAKG